MTSLEGIEDMACVRVCNVLCFIVAARLSESHDHVSYWKTSNRTLVTCKVINESHISVI